MTTLIQGIIWGLLLIVLLPVNGPLVTGGCEHHTELSYIKHHLKQRKIEME